MNMLNEATRLIDAGKVKDFLAFFLPLSESDRRELAPALIKRYKVIDKQWQDRDWKVYQVAHVALLFSATTAELRSCRWGFIGDKNDVEELLQLMIDHPRTMFAELGEYLASSSFGSHELIRRMVKLGITRKPDTPEYYLGLITLNTWDHREEGLGIGYRELCGNREFLEDDVWKMLVLEGTTELSLAARDKYMPEPRTWLKLFPRLISDGHLPRSRFIATLFSTLRKDFPAFRSNWYCQMLAALELSDDERRLHLPDLAALCGATIPGTVSFAFRELQPLFKAAAIPADQVLPILEPCLQARQKTVAAKAVDLLIRHSRKAPEELSRILEGLLRCLPQQSADLQATILEFLLRSRSALSSSQLAELQEMGAFIAPSVVKSFQGLIPVASAQGTIPAPLRFEPPRFEPLSDALALAFALSELLENPRDARLLERCLDGIGRFGVELRAQHQSLLTPLHKRIQRMLKGGVDDWCGTLCLVLAELSGMESTGPRYQRGGFCHFLHSRWLELKADIEAGRSLPPLSSPTLASGEISPADLAGRLRQWTGTPLHRLDAILALQRLGCDGRETLLEVLPGLPESEGKSTLAYALGAHENAPVDKALRLAAVIARHQGGLTVAALPRGGPWLDATPSYTWEITSKTTTYSSGSFTHHQLKATSLPELPRWSGSDEGLLDHAFRKRFEKVWEDDRQQLPQDWLASLMPLSQETYFFCLLPHAFASIQFHEAGNESVAMALHPLLLDAAIPGEMALCVLATLLASAEGPGQSLAVECLVHLSNQDRLDLPKLGNLLGCLHASGSIKLSRWAKSFASAAAHSPRLAGIAAILLQAALRGDPQKAHKDLGALLETLQQALAAASLTCTDSEAHAYLLACGRGGKTGKLIKNLLTP